MCKGTFFCPFSSGYHRNRLEQKKLKCFVSNCCKLITFLEKNSAFSATAGMAEVFVTIGQFFCFSGVFSENVCFFEKCFITLHFESELEKMYRDKTYYPLTTGGFPQLATCGKVLFEPLPHTSTCCKPGKGKRHYLEEESPMPEFC